MPTMHEIESVRAELFADDLELEDCMVDWSLDDVVAYFESGGIRRPTPGDATLETTRKLANDGDGSSQVGRSGLCASECDLDSARSSIDAAVPFGRSALMPFALEALGETDLDGEFETASEDELETGADEEQTEAALIDVPMASVRVSGDRAQAQAQAQESAAEADAGAPHDWSVRQLKDFLKEHGDELRNFTEKSELVREVQRLMDSSSSVLPQTGPTAPTSTAQPTSTSAATSARAASGPPPPCPSPAAPLPQNSEKHARLVHKIQDIKKSGDRAFQAKDFEKAERHYSSALRQAADQPVDQVLVATLYSNRAACRSHQHRHAEALSDGQEALRRRPDWARAHSRVGAALFSLRRWDEAKAAYETGLSVDPGSVELRDGLRQTLTRVGGGGDAAAAKQRGNAFFKAGKHVEAIAAYDDAIAAAPSDETLYSNRSAAQAALGNLDAALADAKRAIALAGTWPKGYSRAGYAALQGGDEEAAYWFYSNGLRWDAQNVELTRGRSAAMQQINSVGTRRYRRQLERYRRDAHLPPARVFAVSDVHYDHAGAREWASALSRTAYTKDTIIVAGDVGDTFNAVKLCLKAFRAVFRRVFYVPGNHDLWIRPKGQHSNEPAAFADSVAKLLALWQMCDEIDVDVGPAQISTSTVVLPLDSWYSYTFDHHDPKPGLTLFDKFCKWPMGYDDAWKFMTGLNESRLEMVKTQSPSTTDVISFSHFLPRKELPLPGVHEMAKASGCLEIESQLRSAKVKLHIFGHTHINTVHEYEGVRYMQNAMGYGIAPGTKLCVVHDGGRFKDYMA
uniref:Calcineurin-like phosphoesterase domain-containing protein n=1 Tax=Chrysotila carterae TaxID=13221 RepID=A0A7S4BN38_CHRCT